MAKTYKAQSIQGNHDWDFSVDSEGDITSLVIRSEVNYGTMGMTEELDIYPHLSSTQKKELQEIYDKVKDWFDRQFLEA